MSYINTIAPGEVTGEARDMFERQQGKYGYVPNYAKVFCYRPELMTLWASLQSGIRQTRQDPRLASLLILSVRMIQKSSLGPVLEVLTG